MDELLVERVVEVQLNLVALVSNSEYICVLVGVDVCESHEVSLVLASKADIHFIKP